MIISYLFVSRLDWFTYYFSFCSRNIFAANFDTSETNSIPLNRAVNFFVNVVDRYEARRHCFWSRCLSMTDVTWKKTVELQSLKTERRVSNMALTAIKSMKTENEWITKEERTICKVKPNAIVAFSFQKKTYIFFRTIFIECTGHQNFYVKYYWFLCDLKISTKTSAVAKLKKKKRLLINFAIESTVWIAVIC